eukprot:scaffold1755_cov202-Prasinococcus_capsulatus_cf.AAC.1
MHSAIDRSSESSDLRAGPRWRTKLPPPQRVLALSVLVVWRGYSSLRSHAQPPARPRHVTRPAGKAADVRAAAITAAAAA